MGAYWMSCLLDMKFRRKVGSNGFEKYKFHSDRVDIRRSYWFNTKLRGLVHSKLCLVNIKSCLENVSCIPRLIRNAINTKHRTPDFLLFIIVLCTIIKKYNRPTKRLHSHIKNRKRRRVFGFAFTWTFDYSTLETFT